MEFETTRGSLVQIEDCMQDADLEQLRETREWLDALDTMKGGLSSRSVAGLRAEAKAPFRLARILTFQGLFAGAAIGLVISSTRLFAALTGAISHRHFPAWQLSISLVDPARVHQQ